MSSLIDRRLILEIFINTEEENIVLQLWRKPSNSKYLHGCMIIPTDVKSPISESIPIKRLRTKDTYTINELVDNTVIFYKTFLKVLIESKAVVEKIKDEKRKKEYMDILPIIQKRLDILSKLDTSCNKDDISNIVNMNCYQSYTLNI